MSTEYQDKLKKLIAEKQANGLKSFHFSLIFSKEGVNIEDVCKEICEAIEAPVVSFSDVHHLPL